MDVTESAPHLVRFGVFELDVRSKELRKAGVRLNLPDQPLQFLMALLQRPGELVTRDELRQRLWGEETFVDFEHGLNAAVKRLRDTLGDSAETPRFIETMPRRGYRFIAPVSHGDHRSEPIGLPARGTDRHTADPENADGLRPLMAFFALSAVIVGTLAIALRAPKLTVLPSDIPNPPEVLASRAREILTSIGCVGARTDSEFWFTPDAPVTFVYRQSPAYLIPQNLFHLVTGSDPPADDPGMATVVLDPFGRLVRFNWILNGATLATGSTPKADWAALFADAGLDPDGFVRVDSDRTLTVPHDHAALWQRRGGAPGPRVSAATLDGTAVLFDVTDSMVSSTGPHNVLIGPRPPVAEALFWASIVLAFAVGSVLARRNLRSGQADRVVARKLSLFIACGGVVFAVLRAHHVPAGLEEVSFLLGVSGWALAWTAFAWLIYVGMEPHLRRLWPDMLISWTRLLAGRVRDPLVGRDVLAGLLGGIGIVAFSLLRAQFVRRGAAGPAVAYVLEALRSPRHVVGALIFQFTDSLQFVLSGLLFLTLLRMIVRNKWIAAGLWVSLTTAVSIGVGLSFGWELAFAAARAMFGLTILLRFGLLTALVMLVFERLMTQMPLTLDPGVWYVESSFVVLLLVLALALYGFLVSLAGRPSFGEVV